MENKMYLIFGMVFLFGIGIVSAGSLVNINPNHFEIGNIYSGDSFETSFSFDYPSDIPENYDNAPFIVRVNVSSNDSNYPVWKGDFDMEMEIKQYTLPGQFYSRTVPLTCTEDAPLEFNSLNGIDLRFIEEIPDGTFYCYNENFFVLELGSRNNATLEVQTHLALYPESYNFSLEFFEIDEFAISLEKGWNLISFPVKIPNNSVGEVFNNSDLVESVWSYENENWKVYSSDGIGPQSLDNVVPGRGYWVKAKEKSFILVGGSLLEPRVTPPLVEVNEGWNLIGHYDFESKNAYCGLFSLTENPENLGWSSLWKFDSVDEDFVKLNENSTMNPGEGYWLGANTPGNYFPSTICL